MPTIPLCDVLGLDVNGKLQQGAKILSVLQEVVNLKDTTLDKIDLDQLGTHLNFEQPIDVSAAGCALKVGAGAGGSLAVIRPGLALDPGDPFSEIRASQSEIYLAVALDFTTEACLSGTAGSATLGFDAGSDISIQCYRRFTNAGQGFPTLPQALAASFSSFVLPRTAADLALITPDMILVLAGTGTVSFSGEFSVALPVQKLASAALVAGQKVDVSAGGSVGVSAQVTIAGGYRVRLQRLASGKIEMGVYKVASRQLEADASAQMGVQAKVAGFELSERLIGALSRQPAVDVEEFRKTLPGPDDSEKLDQIRNFQNTLKGAISTKLQVTAQAAFSNLRSDDAAWSFEIDLSAATSLPLQTAIGSALRGDFTGLTADPKSLAPAIALTKNVLSGSNVQEQTLQVNLLGLVNLLSVVNLAQSSTIERNANGDITLITDAASESRLKALLVNVGGDTRRLRKMLSENFIVEAAYHVANVGVLPPDFQSRHTYLEVDEKTSREEMRNHLGVARILALISDAEVARRLGTTKNFGRTTFYAELKYSNALVRRIFLDSSNKPRSIEEYETLGRTALGLLLAGQEDQELRRRYTAIGPVGNDLWARMKREGNIARFGPLFGFGFDSTDPRVNAAGSDYLVITDWAKAMNAAGAALQEVESKLSAGVTAAREQLKQRLGEVVKDTHDQFGDPLGLLMVYLAAGQSADKTVVAAGDQIERLEVSSPAAMTETAHP